MTTMIRTFSFLFLLTMLFTACKNEGKKAEVSEAEEVAIATGTDFQVVPSASKVMWIGYKPAGQHNGTVDVKDGEITVKDGNIVGGNFTIDMTSIDVSDLEGEYKEKLEAHLRGTGEEGNDDFFNVKKYPTAKFEITKVTNLVDDAEGTHLVYGNLTLKDIVKQVGFKADVDITEDAVKVTTPKFQIDRTDWGINYQSKSVFDGLKDKFINDEMDIAIELTARG